MTAPIEMGLGRHFTSHNPANLGYLARPLLDQREVVRKDTYWTMPPGWGLPLDQGNSPRCTGYGMAHEAACGPVFIPGVDTAWAEQRYRRNVEEDALMGNHFEDQGGGATVEATMRAAKKDKVLTGYVWNLGLNDTIDATVTVGPQTVGTVWKNSMFYPSPDGLLTIAGPVAGGHFYLIAAHVEAHPKWGPGSWIINSWGDWGVGVPQLGLTTGCAFLRDADLDLLLRADGESTCPRDLYEVPPPGAKQFYAVNWSKVFHTSRHMLIRHDRTFSSFAAALAAGLRPCRICRPTP